VIEICFRSREKINRYQIKLPLTYYEDIPMVRYFKDQRKRKVDLYLFSHAKT